MENTRIYKLTSYIFKYSNNYNTKLTIDYCSTQILPVYVARLPPCPTSKNSDSRIDL